MANYKLRFFTKARENTEENTQKYFFSELPTNTQNFRNYWSKWSSVPQEYELYPEDYLGNQKPQNGDYIVVYDSYGYNGRISGVWEFVYVGNWDTVGKDGWKPYKELEKERVPKYTSGKYSCKLYQDKVSVGLIESNTIVILGDDNNGTVAPIADIPAYTPIIAAGWKLLFFIDTVEQSNLRFYTVDKQTEEITWTDRILIDPSDINNLSINLGFIGDQSGEYENNVYICEVRTSKTKAEDLTGAEEIIHDGTMTVYSSAIGEDERYRTLFENFGIPDPISYMEVFKDESLEEKNKLKYDDKIDYEQLNKKSKQLFLSYSDIFPYIGTYRALINAVDFLGYDDIYFKEWYKEISDTPGLKPTLTAYNVSYKSKVANGDKMLTSLPIERRVLLKKMNWLSMIYKITEEVRNEEGDIEYDVLPDNVCFPRIKENYSIYDSEEILVKLFGLKRWLEKNIIALNCRIVDIGGEGITFERYKHRIYGTKASGLELTEEKSLTPYLVFEDDNVGIVNLTEDGANIKVGIKELKDPEFIKSTRDITVRAMMSSNNSILKKYKPGGYILPDNESVVLSQKWNDSSVVKDYEDNPLTSTSLVTTDVHSKTISSPIYIQAAIIDKTKEPWSYLDEYKKTYTQASGNKQSLNFKYDSSKMSVFEIAFIDPRVADAPNHIVKKVQYDLNKLSKTLENGKEYSVVFIYSITSYSISTTATTTFTISDIDIDDTISSKLDMGIVTMPIIIQDGEIFFDPKLLYKSKNDFESVFIQNPVIQIEKANLRIPEKEWSENIAYSMTNDGPKSTPYVLKKYKEDGETVEKIYYKKDYITLREVRGEAAKLRYTSNNVVGVPLFLIQGFQDFIVGKDAIDKTKEYILEIVDGKMIFTGEYIDKYNEKVSRTMYLNFHYDTDASEQSIEVNYVYDKIANTKDLIDEFGEAKLITLNVKNIGKYTVFAFAQDEHNNIFGARCQEQASVEAPIPEISLYTRFAQDFNNEENEEFYPHRKDSTEFIRWGAKDMTLPDQKILPYRLYRDGNSYCIMKEQFLINNIAIDRDTNSLRYVKYPTISYAYDTPKEGYYAHLMNISDKFNLVKSVEIKKDGVGTGDLRVYMRRTGSFSANTLNTKGSINFEQLSVANVVIYDNIHAEPLYQENLETKWTNLITDTVDGSGGTPTEGGEYLLSFIIPKDTINIFFVFYYGTEETKVDLSNVLYLEDAEAGGATTKNKKKVTLGGFEEIPEDDNQVNVIDAMTFNKLFTTYIQASYEIPCSVTENGAGLGTEIVPNVVAANTAIYSEPGKKPIGEDGKLFSKDQIVKLIAYVKNGLQNITTYQVATKIKEVVRSGYTLSYHLDDKSLITYPKSNTAGVEIDLFMAHANQVFNDYEFIVDDAFETIDYIGTTPMNYTHVYLKKDRNLDFVDNTYSISSRSFNVHNAYDYWSDDTYKKDDQVYPTICADGLSSIHQYPKDQPSGKDTQLYKHAEPVTLQVGEDILIYGSRVELLGSKNYNYWRVRKYNPETSKNELIIESWNDILLFSLPETGIYSVELFVYDDFGNLTSTSQEGIFKVIEKKKTIEL